jgi:hypothetical protein
MQSQIEWEIPWQIQREICWQMELQSKSGVKGELLQQRMGGHGGWIVATRASGCSISIEGIIYVGHMGRAYGLTHFVQQWGCGGWKQEVSE